MSLNPSLTTALLGNIPYSTQASSFWTATSITLKRNLARFHFPSKMSPAEKEQAHQLLKTTLMGLQELGSLQYFDLTTLSPSDKELIYEHFLLLNGYQQTLNGSGVLIDQKGTFLALINCSNHLEMRVLALGGAVDASWEKLQKIDAAIGNKLDYAFSPKFGYLTSDPTQCGTGMIVQSYLQLPALIQMNQIERLLPKEDEEVIAVGLSGDLDDLVGDWIILKNAYTLGMTEEAILQSIQTASAKFVGAEKALRAKLKEKGDAAMKDMMSKAYGLLLHSYQLDITEALDYISLMKLGLNLGWITGVNDQKIGELLFKCRRGHFSHLFPETSEQSKDLEHKRAEFLHKELQGLQLAPNLQ